MNRTSATTARSVITTVEKATTKLLKTTVRIVATTHQPKTTKHAVKTTTLADLLRTTTISLLDTTPAEYDYSLEGLLGSGGKDTGGSGSGGDDTDGQGSDSVTTMYGDPGVPTADYYYEASGSDAGSGSGEPIDEQEPQRIFFGVFFVLSFAAIILNFYVSIFGRRMRLAGIRWHTIQINLFNMLQLFLLVNSTDLSPWKGFLHNDALTTDQQAIENMTLSAFYASMIFIIPTTVITYFFPSLSRTHLFQWAIWLPLYLALTVGAVLIFFSNWWTLDPETQNQTTWTSPLQGYQIFVLLAFHFLLVLLFIAVIVAIVLFVVHASMHVGWPTNTVSRRFFRLSELLLFLVYAVVIDGFHMIRSGWNTAPFIMEKVLPIVIEWYTHRPSSGDGGAGGGTPAPGDGGGGGGAIEMPSIPTFAFTFIAWMEPSEMLIPCIEWLCTVACIKMYREQYIHLISCGAIYGDPKHGAFEVVSRRIVGGKGHSGMQKKDARWAAPSPARVQPQAYPAPVEVQQPPSYTTTA
ncbi:Protein Y9C2UA.1 c [Aphelenchoides avenae]|nr:Protein Y9C2UA.1 c [Aphelenchus avenae]